MSRLAPSHGGPWHRSSPGAAQHGQRRNPEQAISDNPTRRR